MPEDTAESGFAVLLRELKDRSGHSYGTLAKRLHMSTSTLHRYCSGEVVPADYAPVERLARLCKASPAELVELHRSWVLADTNRGRKAAGTDAVARAAAAEEPEPAAPLPAATVSADAVDPADLADPSEPADAPDAPDSPDSPDSPDRPGPAAATVPTRRRRLPRAALAAVAVAAVAALAGALVLDTDRQPAGDDVRGGPVGAAPFAPGEARTDDRAPESEEPSAASSAEPSAVPSASAEPSAAQPSGSPPVAPAAGSGPGAPVKVTAQPHTWQSPCDQQYLIGKPPAQVSPPPVERDAPAWVAAAGAVPAGEQYVTLTLQGAGKDTVVLDGLTVRTVGKRTPPAWNVYAMGYPGVGCGAGVPTRSFTVALDAARPAVVPEADQPGFPYKVSESEPEVFHIKADASAYDVTWYLELSWSSGSRHGTLRIDHNGKPFRTSGHNGRPGYEFPLGGDGWIRAGTGTGTGTRS
ncbi:helix-turn-helix domain-containing protein [Streptomyces spororaveus]|uniref:helix-turn-helix domain-containing protein n=1 Tax=Streptomyces spororaveus TaxID=284039 RepID=UPI00369A24DC